MKNFNIFAASLLAAAALAMAAPPACTRQVDTSKPIVVKENRPKPVWLKAEVIRADATQIQVREEKSPLSLHTFTYSAKVRGEIEKVMNQGGYQSGDRIRILFQPGDTVALEIRGKPSKPF